MPNESFEPKNPKFSKTELERRLGLLENQLKIAEVKNPECAGGGCGGRCGTILCTKNLKREMEKIKEEIKKSTEE